MGLKFRRQPKQTTEFFDCRNDIRANPDATYYVFIGQRSNGKTYSALHYVIEEYFKTGKRFVYLRRWKSDLAMAITQDTMTKASGLVKTLSKGEWEFVNFYAKELRLARSDPKTGKTIKGPLIGWGLTIDRTEELKGPEYADCYTVLFDEFIARNGAYCVNEFINFMNMLSSVFRTRERCKIIMCGNSVSLDSIYFHEMGLTKVHDMIPGDTNIYTIRREYTDPDTKNMKTFDMKIYVRMCDKMLLKPEVLSYYAFDNPKVRMIDGGYWEIGSYPHYIGDKIKYSEIVGNFFILTKRIIIQGDIVCKNGNAFVLLHEKTTPLQDDNNDIIFSEKYDVRVNWIQSWFRVKYKIHRKIYELYKEGKFFFSTNEVGEEFVSFINSCPR